MMIAKSTLLPFIAFRHLERTVNRKKGGVSLDSHEVVVSLVEDTSYVAQFHPHEFIIAEKRK